jgi:hypothetical protein
MVQKHKNIKTSLNGLPEPVGISDHSPSSFHYNYLLQIKQTTKDINKYAGSKNLQ